MESIINTIINGDCLVVMDFIADESIDLIVTDSPYNAGFDFANDSLPESEFLAFTERWMKKAALKLKKNGSFYCFIDKRMLGKFQSILDNYLIFRNVVVWHFEAFFNRFHKNYDNRCEFVLFYTKSDDYTFNVLKEPPSMSMLKRWKPYADAIGNIPFEALTPSMRARQSKENYDRNPTNINRGAYQGNMIHSKRVRFREHETQKPEDVINVLLLASSNDGDVVLDPFAGSGTTCAVAKKLHRKYIGIEISREYCDLIEKRMDAIKENRSLLKYVKQEASLSEFIK